LYEHQIAMLKRIPFLRGTTPWILMDFRSPRRQLPGIQDFFTARAWFSERGERKRAFYVMQRFYRDLAAAWEKPAARGSEPAALRDLLATAWGDNDLVGEGLASFAQISENQHVGSRRLACRSEPARLRPLGRRRDVGTGAAVELHGRAYPSRDSHPQVGIVNV